MLFKSEFIQNESNTFKWNFIFCTVKYSSFAKKKKTKKSIQHSTQKHYLIIYKNTFWMDMPKIDEWKVVKIVRRRYASNENKYCDISK